MERISIKLCLMGLTFPCKRDLPCLLTDCAGIIILAFQGCDAIRRTALVRLPLRRRSQSILQPEHLHLDTATFAVPAIPQHSGMLALTHHFKGERSYLMAFFEPVSDMACERSYSMCRAMFTPFKTAIMHAVTTL